MHTDLSAEKKWQRPALCFAYVVGVCLWGEQGWDWEGVVRDSSGQENRFKPQQKLCITRFDRIFFSPGLDYKNPCPARKRKGVVYLLEARGQIPLD